MLLFAIQSSSWKINCFHYITLNFPLSFEFSFLFPCLGRESSVGKTLSWPGSLSAKFIKIVHEILKIVFFSENRLRDSENCRRNPKNRLRLTPNRSPAPRLPVFFPSLSKSIFLSCHVKMFKESVAFHVRQLQLFIII